MTEIRKPDAESLESVYNINKHAKKYAKLADKNYWRGKGATAKANSIKKDALYAVKSRAINRFLLDGDDYLSDAEYHKINGDVFLCLEFTDENGETWSYHQPPDEIFMSRFPSGINPDKENCKKLEGFESVVEKQRSDKSLKECLLYLAECGINANEYLSQKKVQYGSSRYFVGWDYL